tara:strand:- start:457 stop:837 length:381 start_codon:yes stop_codon:yes gene_type:complete
MKHNESSKARAKRLETKKKYRVKHAEEIAIKRREHYLKNKDWEIILAKKNYQKNKQDYYSIYVLEGLNYVGMTNNLEVRMRNHVKNGKVFDRVTILDTAKTQDIAKHIEAEYHKVGYKGAHINAKR